MEEDHIIHIDAEVAKVARGMIRKGSSIPDILRRTGLSVRVILKLREADRDALPTHHGLD